MPRRPRRPATPAFLAWREEVRDGRRISFSKWWMENHFDYESRRLQPITFPQLQHAA